MTVSICPVAPHGFCQFLRGGPARVEQGMLFTGQCVFLRGGARSIYYIMQLDKMNDFSPIPASHECLAVCDGS